MQTQNNEAPIGAALAEVKAKLAAGSSVTPAQMSAAIAKDQLAALNEALQADRDAVELKARQERAVQVASDAKDVWQIVRDEARSRAADAYRQITLQLEAELRAAFEPVQASRREMKMSGVGEFAQNSVGVSVYNLAVDVQDVIEREAEATRLRGFK